jgi:hypothetical protein
MNTKKLLAVTVAIIMMFTVFSDLAAFSITEMLITFKTAFAQVPPAPPFPDVGDLTSDNQLPDTNNQPQLPQQSATPTNLPPPTIQITSHQDGNQVPVGELTIQGTSSDNQQSNCQVYADVNDVTPLQNATAAGANGGDDYSRWTFTYTQDYQLITQGVNELTAKISCFDNVGGTGTGAGATVPLSEWHSVNVTGVASGSTTATTTTAAPPITQTPSPPPSEPLGPEQGTNIIPAPTISIPSSPPTTFQGTSPGLGEGGNGQSEGDDDDGDDDDGDDDDGDDDDGGEGDDG